ncbi:MAG: hypothetical protein ACQKBY_05990 [Verrucomicrobiales bacterium]
MKKKFHPLLTVVLLSPFAVGSAPAAVLYAINSFDANDAVTNSGASVDYNPDLVSVTVDAGLSGTSASQLNDLQTLFANAATQASGGGDRRFRNTDVDTNQTNGTLVTDSGGSDTVYFQFGVSGGGGAMDLTNLVFHAKKATSAVSIRGYRVLASIDGGTYALIGNANLAGDRNTAFQEVDISLSGAQYQDIESIDFRIVSTGGGIEYADFTLNGVVPEPGTACLGALAALGLLKRRRSTL